ncbi:MAG TPA: ISL3 family transposase [Candidatus Portnoybacteria bacterium]|nr:ISL3 family transposase [Candidatus Portnoybacteria bacterium]
MENSEQIFNIALGLEEPWYIKEIIFTRETSRLDIYLEFIKGHKFKMDDGKKYSAYDTIDRTWQHLNFFQYKCYLHAKVPKVRQSDGKMKTQPVPWARQGSGFTLLFEAFSMLLIENEMPVNKAAKTMQIYPNRLWNIFKYWISIAHQKDTIEDLDKIGFDETSIKKGHNYVTTMVDLKQRRVLFATEGKGSDCIEKSVTYLKEKQVDISSIKQVCIDMSPAFMSGCGKHLPDADITFDKFHVMKEVNKAMDELRKLERIGNDMLKNHKYTFLKNKLTPKIKEERDLMLEMYPKLGEGYRLKQLFKDFWDIQDKEDAEGYLAFWCDIAMESGIFPFQKTVNTIKAHWSGIINYIESKINNGILEGLNSKIQLAKKRARGYKNIDNFINMIYLVCGKLKFDYPLY